MCKLLQLGHSQGLQQLNAAQCLDQRLSASFAGSNHCFEGVGIQLKQDACSIAGWLGQKQRMGILRCSTSMEGCKAACELATVVLQFLWSHWFAVITADMPL